MCISVRRLRVLERLPRGRSDHKLQLMAGAEIEGIRIQSLYIFFDVLIHLWEEYKYSGYTLVTFLFALFPPPILVPTADLKI